MNMHDNSSRRQIYIEETFIIYFILPYGILTLFCSCTLVLFSRCVCVSLSLPPSLLLFLSFSLRHPPEGKEIHFEVLFYFSSNEPIASGQSHVSRCDFSPYG